MTNNFIKTTTFLLLIFNALNSIAFDNKTYQDLFYSNEKNISNKWDNYFEVYNDIYKNYINKNANILEIGVQNGGSLQITSELLVNGNIYGIDINNKVCEIDFGKNIKTFCFNASDKDKTKIYLKDIEFDVILDDGSHRSDITIATFKNLFSKIKPGGYYIIEDLHTSYWVEYKGGYLKNDSTIEYLKRMIDLLNGYHIRNENFIQKIFRNNVFIQKTFRNGSFLDKILGNTSFIQNLSKDDLYALEWIKSITFYDSIAVIHKQKQPKKTKYNDIISGKIEPVTDGIFIKKDKDIK